MLLPSGSQRLPLPVPFSPAWEPTLPYETSRRGRRSSTDGTFTQGGALTRSALGCFLSPLSGLKPAVRCQPDLPGAQTTPNRAMLLIVDEIETSEECPAQRHVPVLVRRPNGIKSVLGPDVHLAFADCRSCVDVRVEFIDRQNFPITSSTQHDDLAMLAGDVDLAVDADG